LDIGGDSAEKIMIYAIIAVLALYWIICFVNSIRQWILNRAMIRILEKAGDLEANKVAHRKKVKLYLLAIFMPLFSPIYLADITSDARYLASLFESNIRYLSTEEASRLSKLQEAQRMLLWSRAGKGPCRHKDNSGVMAIGSTGPIAPSFGPPKGFTLFWCKYCLVKWKTEQTYSVITHL
jgi:hypothetical protein